METFTRERNRCLPAVTPCVPWRPEAGGGWLLDMMFAMFGEVRKEVLSTEDSGEDVTHIGW